MKRIYIGLWLCGVLLFQGVGFTQSRPQDTTDNDAANNVQARTTTVSSPRATLGLQNGSFESGLTGWSVVNGNGVTLLT